MPFAWYSPQSHSEKGECRAICQENVRSAKTRTAWSRSGSSRRIENAASVAPRNPPANRASVRGRSGSGYEAHSGATTSAPSFVQPASATAPPRAHGELTSQKPQMSSAGAIASFVFDMKA